MSAIPSALPRVQISLPGPLVGHGVGWQWWCERACIYQPEAGAPSPDPLSRTASSVGRGRVRRRRGRGFDLATADDPPSLPAGDPTSQAHTYTLVAGTPFPLLGPFYPPTQTRTNARRRVYSSACIGTLEKRGFQACDQGSKCRHASSHPDRPERCLKTTTTTL